MAAPKGNKFAQGNNGGNPGYAKLKFISDKVSKHSPLWWQEWEMMMKGNCHKILMKRIEAWSKGKTEIKWLGDVVKSVITDDFEQKKFAMAEFNKIQVKMIPTQLGGLNGEPINMTIKWQNEKLSFPILRAVGRPTSTKP